MATSTQKPSNSGSSAGGRERRRADKRSARRASKQASKAHPGAVGGQIGPSSRAAGSPIPVYSGTFGRAEAERLLWRAGFGPAKGQAAALAELGVRKAVASLTRPKTAEAFVGPEPTDNRGNPLHPGKYGHDHLWFLDRMVRSDQPLTQRMTLIWHDWFATSDDKVNQPELMLAQNETFRAGALGSFKDLLQKLTKDPAMLVWLDGIYNRKGSINENYGREIQELFALGADRGAYAEEDVREIARAFSGWDADYLDGQGWTNFVYADRRHDGGSKTIYGHTGNYDWKDAVRLVLENPKHSSFFVLKLWSYFNPTPPSDGELATLEYLYRANSYAIRPVVEAILLHPSLYDGESMVKSPVTLVAGMLRALGRGIDTEDWVYLCDNAGQRLFYPPNVAGWDDDRWLDTNTTRWRWDSVARAVQPYVLGGSAISNYPDTEDAVKAVKKALKFWGKPTISSAAHASLQSFADLVVQEPLSNYERHANRGLRQNALRHLIAAGPDGQVC